MRSCFANPTDRYMGTSNGFMTTDQLTQWRNLIMGIKDNNLLNFKKQRKLHLEKKTAKMW